MGIAFGINFLKFSKGMQPINLFEIIKSIFDDPTFSQRITSSENLEYELIQMFEAYNKVE